MLVNTKLVEDVPVNTKLIADVLVNTKHLLRKNRDIDIEIEQEDLIPEESDIPPRRKRRTSEKPES